MPNQPTPKLHKTPNYFQTYNTPITSHNSNPANAKCNSAGSTALQSCFATRDVRHCQPDQLPYPSKHLRAALTSETTCAQPYWSVVTTLGCVWHS